MFGSVESSSEEDDEEEKPKVYKNNKIAIQNKTVNERIIINYLIIDQGIWRPL